MLGGLSGMAGALLLLASGCATDHHFTGIRQQPVPVADVRVYQTIPTDARPLGTLSVQSYSGLTVHQLRNNVMDQLKSQAAVVGGNGLVLETDDEQPMSGATATATVFYVER